MALIIGGLNGSGKTLLRALCDSHSLVEVTEEFKNFVKLNVCYKEYVQTLRTNWNKYPFLKIFFYWFYSQITSQVAL